MCAAAAILARLLRQPEWGLAEKRRVTCQRIVASGQFLLRSVDFNLRCALLQFSTQSAHFCTSSLAPHGMTGTDDVEFFGEPSISLSE
jgi:hypothetical protein